MPAVAGPMVDLRGGDKVATVMITSGGSARRRQKQQQQPYSPKTPARSAAPSTTVSAARRGESPSGSTSTTTTTTTTSAAGAPSSTTSWTLYDNPCFCSSHFYPDHYPQPSIHRYRRRHHHHRKPLLTPEKPTSSSTPMREQLGTVLERERAMVALETERTLREEAEAQAEALRLELARERRRREDAEQRAAKASDEAARWKAETERIEALVCAAREAGAAQEQRARAQIEEARVRFEEERRKLRLQIQRPAAGREDPTATGGGNSVVAHCDRGKEQQHHQQQQQVASAPEQGRGSCSGAGANLSPATTPCQQPKHQKRDSSPSASVENPHIRRGIIGFVEFPRVVGRPRGGSPAASGKAGGPPKLECQKAQLRVLLKGGGGGKVAPVAGFPSSAPPHNLVM